MTQVNKMTTTNSDSMSTNSFTISNDKFVIKRDGSKVNFDKTKIQTAILHAFRKMNEGNLERAEIITNEIYSTLASDVPLEHIQDCVEKKLMEHGLYNSAKEYIIYRSERHKLREKVSNRALAELVRANKGYFGNDPLREFIFYRTYSRWTPELSRREVWTETVERYMSFMKEKIGTKLTEDDYSEIQESILTQSVMPSMRLLQFSGQAARRCNVCAYNCSYVVPVTLRSFAEILYVCLSGTGVGFSVEKRFVDQLPNVAQQKSNSKINKFTVEDSKEGWCNVFLFVLETLFKGEDIDIDYSLLRPAGARLKTTGGRSSGPQALKELVIFTRNIILSCQGGKLSTLNVYDIICKEGQCVMAGGTRRSALLSLSDLSDTRIRDAKVGAFWEHSGHRIMTNNSAAYTGKIKMLEFMEEWLALARNGTGERGIFNRGGLVKVLPDRRVKILGDKIHDLGVNPCAEILLQPQEFCNLTEVVCREEDTLETLLKKIRMATILGTYQATLIDFKFLSDVWKRNQEEERLLGVSLTGHWDCPEVRKDETLSKLKLFSIDINKEFSKKFGIKEASAITTTKPSGTCSQLTNSSSGIHPRFSPYYIRRVRIAATDPLFKMLRDQGVPYNPEVGEQLETATTFVLDFPVKSPDNARCVNDISAIEQLEYWKQVKTHYTEHNPSVTIYIKEHEWLQVGEWVYKNFDYIVGISFLPYTEHVYQLAPYEAISKDKFEELQSKFPQIHYEKLVYYELEDATDVKRELACASGVCELL